MVNVIGRFTVELGRAPFITVTNKQNILILHPDILITSTSIANSSHCIRRPILSTLVRKSSDVTPSLVWGNMLHEVVQQCLMSQRWDEQFIDQIIDEIIMAGLEDLVKISFTVSQAKVELQRRAEGLKTFGKKYIGEVTKVHPQIYAKGCR